MRKFFRLLPMILPLLMICSILSGCQKEIRVQSKAGFDYFDTVSYVYSYLGDTADEFEKTCDDVFALEEKYHRLFDIYNLYDGVNNLCTINANAGIAGVEVDSELIEFLLFCKEMYELTDGETNVMMGSVLKIWHIYRTKASTGFDDAGLPTEEELCAAAVHTGIDSLIIDTEKSVVYISDPQASIDVGAVAKGYAVQKIAQYLKENNKTSYVLNFGGNIKTVSTKTDGSGWTTGIRNPLGDNNSLALKIVIADTSCVTSGNYERYYTVNDIRYHHIIDKDTCYPAVYFASVTVITPNSALADGLSTALFCMSLQHGMALIDTIDECEAIWIDVDGNITMSEGAKKLCVE